MINNNNNNISAATINAVYNPSSLYTRSCGTGPGAPGGGNQQIALSDICTFILNTPEYCEFFKNLPTWVFDYQQLHNKIEKINEKFTIQIDEAYVNFTNCFNRSPVYGFKNFDVLHITIGVNSKSEIYQIQDKNSSA